MDFASLLDPRVYPPDGPASEIATPGILTFLGGLYDGVQSLARPAWLYGDESDGSHVAVDGEVLASGNYTDLTIPPDVTVHVGPLSSARTPIIAATGTVTIAGTIAGFGADAVKSAGGDNAFGYNELLVFGSPVQPTRDGAQGVGAFGYGGSYVAGGNGGDGSAGSGGAAGTVDAGMRPRARFLYESIEASSVLASAGSGAGDSVYFGGGAGGAGGALFIFARKIVFAPSSLLDFHGGAGAAGGWSDNTDGATGGHGNCGGGGGGPGGFYATVSGLVVGTPNSNLEGGAAGAHTGTGTDGAPGNDGCAVNLDDRG